MRVKALRFEKGVGGNAGQMLKSIMLILVQRFVELQRIYKNLNKSLYAITLASLFEFINYFLLKAHCLIPKPVDHRTLC